MRIGLQFQDGKSQPTEEICPDLGSALPTEAFSWFRNQSFDIAE
jgi:hypothetical protein